MKKYKNYIIWAGILILGIIIGNLFSGGGSDNMNNDGHNHVEEAKATIWTCSMHPQIRSDKPGKCPICGMDLIPLDDVNDGSEAIASNEIVMTPEAIQLANIQTTTVEQSSAKKEIRLLGRVKPDERRLYSQVSHIPGRIEHLYVNFTGEKVYKGQPIVRLYSPDLISAQKELFEAIRSRDVYPQLYTASRNKLKLWKLSDAQIDAIEKSGKVNEQVDIYSDYSGYVMKRNVELGDHVMAGGNLFDIANLSIVWIMFEAYESDIPWIHIGDEVDFTIQAIPGKYFKGKVTYVDPFVSPTTRVANVRVEINNLSHNLLPEMYATGIIKAKLGNVKDALVVPKSAVLWTGKRAVVYVKVPHEKTISFVYREIELGQDMGDFYIVNSGLEAGDVVATNGVFRIDASAQLAGKPSMMNPQGSEMKNEDNEIMESSNSTSVKEVNFNLPVDSGVKEAIQPIMSAYLEMKDALVNDDFDKAKASGIQLLTSTNNVNMNLFKDKSHEVWMGLQTEIKSELEHIEHYTKIDEIRNAFVNLSNTMISMANTFKPNETLFVLHCPMANNNKGADWLSNSKEIKNPYYGAAMLTCGEVKDTIKNNY